MDKKKKKETKKYSNPFALLFEQSSTNVKINKKD